MTNEEMKRQAVGRKLKNILQIFDEDQVLFIGAKTAFFFIGTKEEYENDMASISKAKKELLLKQVCESKSRAVDILEDLKKEEVSDESIARIYEVSKRLARYCGSYINGLSQLDAYLSYDDRIVKDVYIRDSVDPNPKEIVINVSGLEVGNYWTRNEYLADSRKNKPILKNFAICEHFNEND